MIGSIGLWWQRRQNQLIQASKTVLIVIVTWLLLLEVNAYAQIIGTFAGGFLSLFRFGRSRNEQFFTVLYSAVGILIITTLALNLYSIPWLSNVVFVVLVFIAFFLRRFGGRFFLPPMFVVLMYIVIELMPKPPMVAMWLAIGVATIVALVLIFFVFPVDDRKQIQNNMQTLFNVAKETSNAFIEDVQSKTQDKIFFESQRNYIKISLNLRNDNVRILNEFLLLEQDEKLENFCNYHYRIAKTFAMLFESCEQLVKCNEVPSDVLEHITLLMKQLVAVLSSSKVNKMKLCLTSLSDFRQKYEKFRKYPFKIDLTLPDSVHIFNFSLGMERVVETLALWEKECE
ncbi:FUSC family protein [Piscirickettsia litoralis]|nr:hypothetical protein [Piscirickettsia litoralis]